MFSWCGYRNKSAVEYINHNWSWYLKSLPPLPVLFFQARALFCIENANFWPILAILSQIYAVFGALFAGLNSVAVNQFWQISGMIITHKHVFNFSKAFQRKIKYKTTKDATVIVTYSLHPSRVSINHQNCCHETKSNPIIVKEASWGRVVCDSAVEEVPSHTAPVRITSLPERNIMGCPCIIWCGIWGVFPVLGLSINDASFSVGIHGFHNEN